METKIVIEVAENNELQLLYNRYCSFMNMLGFLAKYGSLETELFDKKWEEAVVLNQQVENMKSALDKKYHPQDGIAYTEYSFDFENRSIVYKV